MTQAPENRTLSDKFMLRLPDGMRDRIKDAAAANNRSMNAEIVATLEEKYPAETLDDALAAAIDLMKVAIAGYEAIPNSPETAQAVANLRANLDMFRAMAGKTKRKGRD